MNKALIIILIGFISSIAFLSYFMLNASKEQKVYDVCIKAHNELNRQSEIDCADMQDYYNFKFTCSDGRCEVTENDN